MAHKIRDGFFWLSVVAWLGSVWYMFRELAKG